jgi:hypothetical protein
MSLGREFTDADRGKKFARRDESEPMIFVGILPFLRGKERCCVMAYEDAGVAIYSITGQYDTDYESGPDIVSEWVEPPKPVTVTRWFNAYPGREIVCHASRDAAEKGKFPDRIACIKREITYTPGEGLAS